MSTKLTYEELCRHLFYDPLTGLFTRKITNANSVQIGDIAGTKLSDGYIAIYINNIPYKAHILAWFYVHKKWPENEIDHKDRVRHHNWIKNLRDVPKYCNQINSKIRTDNTSKIKGVSWNKNEKKWRSFLSHKKQQTHLGYYEDFDNAVCARLAGEQCVNWEEYDSNSPAFQYVKENIQ